MYLKNAPLRTELVLQEFLQSVCHGPYIILYNFE